MRNFVLSKAMGDIPDDLLQEAMEVRKKSSIGWMIFRAAACLAVVIGLLFGVLYGISDKTDTTAGQSILSVAVFASDLSSATVLSEDTVLPVAYQWHPGTNFLPGQPITLSVPETEYASNSITFKVSVDGGEFYIIAGKQYQQEYNGQTIYYSAEYRKMAEAFEVSNHTTIFWSSMCGGPGEESFFLNGTVAFADIIILDGEKILGYAILRFDRVSPEGAFLVSMVESVSFTSEHDAITEEYVRSLMQEAKER